MMDALTHIKLAEELLAGMVVDGHLETNFELSKQITAAQYDLQEARRIIDRERQLDGD